MAVNELTVEQASTVLNSVVSQATGNSNISALNGADFATVAQVGLKAGYDPILNAIGQVLTRTIFSSRPYTAKFKGVQISRDRWGNIVRKLQLSDQAFDDNQAFELVDGQSIDMYKVKKPAVKQTNFYGSITWQKQSPTIYKDQLDVAFSNPGECAQFYSMIAENVSNQIEQANENMARAILCNFIAGRIAENNENCVRHLVTEYAAAMGIQDKDTVMQPANFDHFMKWVFAEVATAAQMMTERSSIYHTNFTGLPIERHTNPGDMRVYLNTPTVFQTNTRVLADAYHDNYLRWADHENVNFWQSIKSPSTINTIPVYMKPDGTLTSPETAVNNAKVFGVLFDRDALGYNICNEWSAATPFNAAGGYTNLFYHFTHRYWNDFTENGIVLLLD